jgi:inosine-uridine nucleoside N-ribohydrolase
VFDSGIDVTMVGLDVTHRALMTPEHAESLRATGRVGEVVYELWSFYHRFHRRVYDFPGTPIHDALAVAHVIRGDLLTTVLCNVEVECGSELCRGRTVADVWNITERPVNAHVATEVRGDTFIDLLLERIGSLD